MAIERPQWATDMIKANESGKKKDQITIVPGILGGVKEPVYTGAGADGRIQPDNPVAMDMMALHEGEVVVPADDVEGMGGPNQAMQKIKQLQMKKMQNAAPGITGMRCGGKVKMYNKGGAVPRVYGYQDGGIVAPVTANQERQDVGGFSIATPGLTTENPPLKDFTDENPQVVAARNAAPTVTGAPSYDLTDDNPQVVAARRTAGFDLTDENPQVIAARNAAPGISSGARIPGTEGGDIVTPQTDSTFADNVTPVAAPTPVPPKEGDTKMVTYNGTQNKLTYKNGQWLSDTQLGLQATGAATPSTVPGVTVGQQPGSAAYNVPATPSTAPGGIAPATFNRYTQTALQRMNSIASGDSDIFRRQANAAFLQLDARLQSNMLAQAMQIANNPNLSDGAKTTMMAEQLRNAGLAQSGLAGELAKQSMQMAMDAIGKTYDMASGERAYNQDLLRQSISDAEAAGDWTTFANQYEKAYGTKLDITNIKTAKDAETVSDATAWIMDQFVPGLPVTLATTGVRGQLERIWNVDHPGQPMDEAWANDWLTEHAKTMDDRWQFMNGIDERDAMVWFPDDAAFKAFTYKDHPAGLESFRNAFYDFQAGGAFTVDPETGAFDFNEKSPFYALMMKTFGMTPSEDGAPPVEEDVPLPPNSTYKNGDTISTTVVGAPKDGDTKKIAYNGMEKTLTYNGGQWLSAEQLRLKTAGAAGGEVGTQARANIPEEGFFTADDGTVYVDGDPLDVGLSGATVRTAATQSEYDAAKRTYDGLLAELNTYKGEDETEIQTRIQAAKAKLDSMKVSPTGYSDENGVPVIVNKVAGDATYPANYVSSDGKYYANGILNPDVKVYPSTTGGDSVLILKDGSIQMIGNDLAATPFDVALSDFDFATENLSTEQKNVVATQLFLKNPKDPIAAQKYRETVMGDAGRYKTNATTPYFQSKQDEYVRKYGGSISDATVRIMNDFFGSDPDNREPKTDLVTSNLTDAELDQIWAWNEGHYRATGNRYNDSEYNAMKNAITAVRAAKRRTTYTTYINSLGLNPDQATTLINDLIVNNW